MLCFFRSRIVIFSKDVSIRDFHCWFNSILKNYDETTWYNRNPPIANAILSLVFPLLFDIQMAKHLKSKSKFSLQMIMKYIDFALLKPRFFSASALQENNGRLKSESYWKDHHCRRRRRRRRCTAAETRNSKKHTMNWNEKSLLLPCVCLFCTSRHNYMGAIIIEYDGL